MKTIVGICMAACLALASDAAFAQYFKIGDIKGESGDAAHKEWIELISVATPLNPASPPRAPGRITLRKRPDAATVKLQEALAKGTLFPDVALDLPKGRRGTASYLRWKLKKVRIASYSLRGSGRKAVETIVLSYEQIGVQPSAASVIQSNESDLNFITR